MIEEFNNYVNNYDINLDGISRKYKHSFRVMELSKKYAKLLNFSDEDVELASIIGLLHDIGRFEQYAKYKSFDDYKTFDHADYGVKILFEDGLISKFTDRKDDYELIKFAIRNHNKIKIEDTNNKDYVRFAKLIRDVDKLDIVFIFGYLGELKNRANRDNISDNVLKAIYEERQVDKRDVLNNNDDLAILFGFVFDINYDIVLEEFKRNIYYYYKAIGCNDLFSNIYNRVVDYIDERIGKNVR